MLKNYLKTAIRSLNKNKGFTTINLLGLTLGLTSCLMIVLYVVDELSYDKYNVNHERIFRVNAELKLGDNQASYAVCMPPLAKTLKAEYPFVAQSARIKPAGTTHVKKGNLTIVENRIAFADPGVFTIFTLPAISGDMKTALKDPQTVVLTESTAKKYFNTTDAVGKTIVFNDKDNFKVTGVIKDIPQQSHFNFDFFVSMESLPDSRTNKWLENNYNTYVLLKDKKDAKALQASLPTFLRKFSGQEMQADLGMSYDQFEKSGSFFRLNLSPLDEIHVKSARIGELSPNGSAQYVYIFSAIAIFILLIACVNFMNLSTARSANRAREVGVRKVLGSSRKHLVFQFLAESTLVTLLATAAAFVAAIILLPLFNQLAGKDIVLTMPTLQWLIPVLFVVVIMVGALAGSYPAFYLSAFQPVAVLKGKLSAGFKSSVLRNFLVVFQFSISVFLIIGTLVIYNQLNFIQTKNLGYNRNQVLVIQNAFELSGEAATFKQELSRLPGVVNSTMTGFLPTSGWGNTRIFFKDATLNQRESLFPQTWEVDADWIPTLGMKMAAGRNFSREMQTDSSAVIINESAAKFLGFKDAGDQTLYQSLGGKTELTNTIKYHVIGIVKDFNFRSLREKVEPMVLKLGKNNGAVSVKANTANLPALMSQVKNVWSKFSPGLQMNYSFMDQDFDAIYRSEQRVGKIFVIFTVLAIIVACLGLFGLAAYAAEQRTKEIGIRKVLGADVSSIVAMLSRDFVKLVLLAVAVAAPLGWYLMNKWLQDFAYRVHIQWWVIAVAGIAALLIAFVTISFQSVKAALLNPVNSLKDE